MFFLVCEIFGVLCLFCFAYQTTPQSSADMPVDMIHDNTTAEDTVTTPAAAANNSKRKSSIGSGWSAELVCRFLLVKTSNISYYLIILMCAG